MLNDKLIQKLKRYKSNAILNARTICPFCGESVSFRHESYTNVEYIRYKNGNDRFFHTDCFINYTKGGSNNVND